MTIPVTCPNGHKLKAKDSHAGRSLACPACGATIVVPTPEADPLADAGSLEEVDLSAPLGASEDLFSAQTPAPSPYAATPVSQPAAGKPVGKPTPKPASKAAPKQASNNMTLYLLIGGGAGGSLAAILLLLVIWLVFGRSGKEGSPNKEVAQAASSTATPGAAAATNDAAAGAAPPNNAAPIGATPGAATPGVPAAGGAPPIDMAAINQQVSQIVQDVLSGKPSGTEKVDEISRKLKQIGLAFHIFHDQNRAFAFPRLRDIEVVEPNRRPPPTGLSWRVHLLPYLDQKPLYDSFHLDEPWDSEHNKTLLDKMPEVYRISSADKTTTRFQVITGPNALFGRPAPAQMRDLSDGSRHTILALVVGTDRGITWTQPDELTLDPSQPIASLGTLPDKLIMCVMADGATLILHDNIKPADFLALTTPAGKEIIDAETFRRQYEEESWDALENKAKGLVGGSAPGAPAASSSPEQLLAAMASRMNKLKEVVLAMHNYHDTYRQFPLSKDAKNFDSDGKPFLSWRVHLLPFLDQQPLYDQFKKDEPWDSPHNSALIDKMPEIFRDSLDQPGGSKTRFVTLTGPDTPFSKPQGPSFPEFRDGTATTLLIVLCGPDKAVTWTQPEDVAFDPASPVGCLGTLGEPAIFYARADGAVKALLVTIPPELFKAIVTPSGGEQLPRDFANFEAR